LSAISFQKEGKIGIIEIDYPSTLNSLCEPVRREFHDKLQMAEESDARVIIIKGNQRSFSTGGDLSELGTLQNPVEAREYVEEVQNLVKRIYNLPKVTIALVEGHAVGAGFRKQRKWPIPQGQSMLRKPLKLVWS